MCRKRYSRKPTSSDVITTHAGVIGLCAFVNASPYDVVAPVPEIFQVLGEHLCDPQPIPVSTKISAQFNLECRKILGSA
jgi:Domain of unknown function (DUF3437).